MKDFRRLAVWQKSHALTLKVYEATRTFPRHEEFGLTGQLRRAAASIPTNIAEGCGREGDAELTRFLRISLGSASEVEYELLLSHDLAYLPNELYMALSEDVGEVKRMLAGLISRTQKPVRLTRPRATADS